MSADLPKKQRLLSIDIIKAFAVLLILNHRMHPSYGTYSILATGGALGCALFFFLSGYTLNSTPIGSFKSWIQKRIGRLLFPIMVIGFLEHFSAEQAFIIPGIWFVQCIVLFYLAFYFIKKYCERHLLSVLLLCSATYLVFFISMWHCSLNLNLYGSTYTKWLLFFLFFLSGALWYEMKEKFPLSTRARHFLLIPSILGIAGEMIFRFFYQKECMPSELGFISPIILLSAILLLNVSATAWDDMGASSRVRRIATPIFASVAALSLESYIGIGPISKPLQMWLAPLFPFNIPLVMLILLVFCYGLRVATRLCMALTSRAEDKLSWRFILAPY